MPSCVCRPRFSLLCDIPSREHGVYYQRPVAGRLESFHFATVRSEAPVHILAHAFKVPVFQLALGKCAVAGPRVGVLRVFNRKERERASWLGCQTVSYWNVIPSLCFHCIFLCSLFFMAK